MQPGWKIIGDSGGNTPTVLPVAGFTVDQNLGDNPLSVQFTNTSIDANSYHWDFGDGLTSIEENPTHQYASVGVYTVKLTATLNGISSISTKYDLIIVSEGIVGGAVEYGWASGYVTGWVLVSGSFVADTNAFGHPDRQNMETELGVMSFDLIRSIFTKWNLGVKVYTPGNYSHTLNLYNGTDYYQVSYESATGNIYLRKYIGTTLTTIATSTSTYDLGTTTHLLGIEILSDGTITALLDDTVVATTNDTDITSITKMEISSQQDGNKTYPAYDGVHVSGGSGTHENIEKLLSTPILSPSGEGWNGLNQGCPRIISINGETRMYHLGQAVGGVCSIGYAIEHQNIGTFVEAESNPISNIGSNTRIGSILKIGELYYLYYGTEPATNIKLATSTDGITFTTHANSPVLSPTETESHINLPYVIKIGETYYMYYTNYVGGTYQPNQYKVASSTDGISWTKHGIIMELGSNGAFDDSLLEDKSIFVKDGVIYLVYEGYDGSVWRIGCAKSTDPIGTFTKSSENPIFAPSGETGTFDEYQTATPLLYEINNTIFLLYQGGDNPTYSSSNWSIGLALVRDINLI